MAGPPTAPRVSVQELRRLFNDASYLTRTLNGTFTVQNFGAQSVYQNPSDLRGHDPEPEGTISGLIEIIDPATNGRVAVAHRLLRPDGSFGASGLPDPKMVIVDGVIYLQKRKEGREPQDQRLPSLFTDNKTSG